MNGIYNAIMIIILMFSLIALDYIYSISDKFTSQLYGLIQKNKITDMGFKLYSDMRTLMYGGITGVLVPWIIFLSFASSFINRNQDIIGYLIANLVVVLLTPIAIYLFSEIATQMLNVSILNSAYMATTYLNNFLYIMVANMLLSLASFVFLQKKNLGY